MSNKTLPSISVVILTKNSKRVIRKCLESIKKQDYPSNKLEIIIIDGNSNDGTVEIVKSFRLPIKLIKSNYPDDPEAGRGEGLSMARNEILAYIDSDNYLPHKNFFKKLVKPFVEDSDVVGSYTTHFGYVRKHNYLNRYFSLIGSADPVGLYLGKADRMSYITKTDVGFAKLVKETDTYFLVNFEEKHFPTLGSNAFFARKKLLKKAKSDPKHYFHIDVPIDLARLGLSKYALVKDVTIHDTAAQFFPYLKKRADYMKLHYQKRAKDRRYKVFDPSRKEDIFRLFLLVFFAFTFIQPLYVSFKGFLRVRDWAWFVHPIFTFAIVITYIWAVLLRYAKR